MIIEFHVLQNFSPSCLNRDDVNAPKDCEFGGFRRARISSQCLKRAIRFSPAFSDAIKVGIATRTKLLASELAKYLEKTGHDVKQAARVAEAIAGAIGNGIDDKGRTAVALYLGMDEIQRIGELAAKRFDEIVAVMPQADETETEKKPKKGKKDKDDKLALLAKEITDGFKPGTTAADVALFGRMIADSEHFNVDAACQMAHAISTHRVSMESDFFTAVDDLQPAGEMGAGMMGTQEFVSACFYRYSLVDVKQLAQTLGGNMELACEAVLAFARAMVMAIPSAKQNSHAAQNPPDFVMTVVRDGGFPASYANAFQKPVRPGSTGLMESSITELAAYDKSISMAYGKNGEKGRAWFSTTGVEVDMHGKVNGLDALVAKLAKSLEECGK
ncbi:MAG: type I-E CRISPR-associated protein Cas7/Cse4/CasC [bacterium]